MSLRSLLPTEGEQETLDVWTQRARKHRKITDMMRLDGRISDFDFTTSFTDPNDLGDYSDPLCDENELISISKQDLSEEEKSLIEGKAVPAHKRNGNVHLGRAVPDFGDSHTIGVSDPEMVDTSESDVESALRLAGCSPEYLGE